MMRVTEFVVVIFEAKYKAVPEPFRSHSLLSEDCQFNAWWALFLPRSFAPLTSIMLRGKHGEGKDLGLEYGESSSFSPYGSPWQRDSPSGPQIPGPASAKRFRAQVPPSTPTQDSGSNAHAHCPRREVSLASLQKTNPKVQQIAGRPSRSSYIS